MATCDVIIVGAGPYGLSAAAHLRRIKGLDVRVFGEPMEFWKCQMPEGMFLRSPWPASNLSDPDRRYPLDAYRDQTGAIDVPIPIDSFVQYGLWFQQQAVGDVDRRRVARIESSQQGFRVTLNDGEALTTRRVVIASGIGPFANRPAPFKDVPPNLATHSSDQRDVKRFRGKRVVVLGAGQSALESAALIHEAGGNVELIIRNPSIHWLGWRERITRTLGPFSKLLYSPYDIGTAGVSKIVAVPDMVKYFPRPLQNKFRTRALRPAGSRWLIDRLATVPIAAQRTVVSAVPSGDELHLKLDDGAQRQVDHVVLGTGYRMDISRYSFLPHELSGRLNRSNGFPLLSKGLESSIPGLHFLGAPAAWTYGPLMYFVCGTDFAARALSKFVAGSAGPR